MKLHLPKLLLAAVFAACSVAWGFTGPVESYAAGGTIDSSPTVTENTAYTLQTSDVAVSAGNYHIKFSDGYTESDHETALGTITAESLWIAQGRYVFDANDDLSGVGSVYINGASTLQFSVSADATVNSNLSIGTSTYTNNSTWSSYPNLCNAAIIFGYWNGTGKTVTLNGSLEVQENTRITFQYGNNAILNGELKGSGNLDLAYYTGAAGSLTIVGDSSTYTGAFSFTGGNVNVKLGNAAVRLGGLSGGSSTNSIVLADGTTASTLTLNVAENASYTYTGALGTGISLEKTGAGNQTLSGITLSNDITVTAGTLTLTGVTTSGEMSISGEGTLSVTNTITNSGTLSLNMDSISLGELDSFTVKENGTTSYSLGNENGFLQQSGAKLYLVQGSGAKAADGAVAILGSDTYALTSDDSGIWFTTGDFTSTVFYITTGEIEVVGVGGTGTETGAREYVLQGGTMQLTSGTVKTSEIEYTSGNVNIAAESAILQIDSADNAGGYITSTTGSAGTIDLISTAIVDNGGTTQFGGTLKVSTGGVLMLGSSNFASGTTDDWTVDVSSLDNIELVGGELKFRGGSANLGDIKVTAASTLHLYDAKQYDVGAEGNSLVTIDTLDLGANLTLSTTWKSNASIGLLTGSDADAVMTVGDCSDNKRMLTANIAHDFAGTINVNGGDAVISNLNVKASDNTTNVVTLTGMKATGEGYANNYLKVTYSETDKTVTIARKRSAEDEGTVISSVGLTDGSTLKFHGDSNQIVTTIEELNVAGSATVLANWNEGNIAITGLTGTGATLNLKSITPTSRNTLFSLNDSETKPSNFSGIINVSTATNSGARRTVFNLNSAEAAKNAVISLENTSTKGDGDTLALAIGADAVTVAGVKDGANNNSSKGTLMIVSGTQGIGEDAIVSDTTARTLVVNTAGKDYTSSAKVSSSINLVKSGEGTQNFSGDMSSFNGTVEVSGGTLGFTKTDGTVTVSSLTLSGGKLDVTNSLTLSTVTIDLTKYEAGTNIVDLVAAGTLLTGENYSVSYVGGVTTVGSYTGTVKKVDNSLVLTWADAIPEKTSLITTISGVSGLFDSENNMLTLNIGADDSLANVGDVTISGISDDIMKYILGLEGLPEDGMVGITLLDKNGEEFTGGINGALVFQGNTGKYEGVTNVGSATQYYVAYIPEPATATLSLLALAGLAARRRRKA